MSRTYLNDGLLSSETTTVGDGIARNVAYTYTADGQPDSLQYPANACVLGYAYSGRNQLQSVINNLTSNSVASFTYDLDGDMLTRTQSENGTSSTYGYDSLDRVTSITHQLTGGNRTFGYNYDSVGNRSWTQRDGGNGDVFGYDLNSQANAVLLNVANPNTTAPGTATITYDAAGNRVTFGAYGQSDSYTTNNLNQYTTRNSSTIDYDADGDATGAFDGSGYTYDAKGRLLTAAKGGTTETFQYDGLGRQVSRTIGSTAPVYNAYSGWNLIGEYQSGSTSPQTAYVYAMGGLAKVITTSSSLYCYQDGSGSTSHLADSSGQLLEWYRYDLQGTPLIYDGSNNQLAGSTYAIRHLFAGQQWYAELGLYDLRHRFYSPDMGRFLQPDPVGFSGDSANIYRYCRNNPTNAADPFGLDPEIQGMGNADPKPDEDAGDGSDNQFTGTFSGDDNEQTAVYDGSGGDVLLGTPPSELGTPNSSAAIPVGASDVVAGGAGEGGTDSSQAEGGGGSGMGSDGAAGDDAPSGPGGGGGNGGPQGSGSSGGLGAAGGGPIGIPSGRGDGPLFEIDAHALSRFGPDPATAKGLRQFANVTDVAVSIYVIGTMGPAGIEAGGLFISEAGPVAVNASKVIWRYGVVYAATHPEQVKAAYDFGTNALNIQDGGYPTPTSGWGAIGWGIHELTDAGFDDPMNDWR